MERHIRRHALAALAPDHDLVVGNQRRQVLRELGRGQLGLELDGAFTQSIDLVFEVEDALVAEASSGRISAALDVTEPEPLPADHPLWSIPGVLITPHVGGGTTAMKPHMVGLIAQQLERFASGRDLLNVVPRS